MPNPNTASHFLDGISNFVPDMQYSSEVNTQGLARPAIITAPVALDADGIVAAASVAVALTSLALAATYAATDAIMGKYGRAVSVVLSGAGTPVIQVRGRDYLGQPVREDITAAGATPVNGKKAFKWIDSVTNATLVAATTINVGWINVFGLPWCADQLIQESVSDAATTDAGTFVAAVKSTATATTGDTRGTYAPHANNVPNSSRTYRLVTQCDKTRLHGVAQYYA